MDSPGRSATPIRVHQLWDAIYRCSTGSQGSVTFEPIMTIVTSMHKVSRGELNRELEAAVRDKLIICDVIQSQKHGGTKLYKLPKQEITKPDHHDWYCFICHLGTGAGPLLGCKDCPRIFHLDCLPSDQKPDGDLFICPPCHLMTKKPSAKLLNLKRKELNKLLEYSCHFLEDLDKIPELNSADGKTWAIASDRKAKDKWRYDLLVYFNMDLAKMLEKAVGNKYQSLEEFQVDCETLLHGISVYFGVDQPKGEALATSFHKEFMFVIQEMKLCPECAFRYYEKEKFGPLWFCLPCKIPHQAVLAKLSDYPHWPAKLMRVDGSKYEVLFFGGKHEWGTIDVKNILPVQTPLSSLKFRKTNAWNKAYEEMKRFLEIAEDPEKINSLPTTRVGERATPRRTAKSEAEKRAASSSVEKMGTKKIKKEVKAKKSQEDIEAVKSIINISNHDYQFSSPAALDNDENSEASTSSIPNLLQEPPAHISTEDLTKIKTESDFVPIKYETDQDMNQEIFTSFALQSRENGACRAQNIENNTTNNNMQESEKEMVVKLQEEIKKCTQHFNALSREKTEMQRSLQKEIEELKLANDQKQTTISAFNSLMTQQWTENSQLKSQNAEQQTQIEELNNKIRLNDQDQQAIEIHDLNSIIALQTAANEQLKSQVAEQGIQIQVLKNKLKLNEQNQASDENSDPEIQEQNRDLPTKIDTEPLKSALG